MANRQHSTASRSVRCAERSSSADTGASPTLNDLPFLLTEVQVAATGYASVAKLRRDRVVQRGLSYVKIGRNVRYRRSDLIRKIEAGLKDFEAERGDST